MRDSNTLQYHRARYYSPGLASWASLDFVELLNRYNYASSDPINRIDPNGLIDFELEESSIFVGTTTGGGGVTAGNLALSESVAFTSTRSIGANIINRQNPAFWRSYGPPSAQPTRFLENPSVWQVPPSYTPSITASQFESSAVLRFFGANTFGLPAIGNETLAPFSYFDTGFSCVPAFDAVNAPLRQPQEQEERNRTDPRRTIVELGAGDYSNAIAWKLANPETRVIATNSRLDWEIGKDFYQVGLSASEYFFIGFYTGWLEAKSIGIEVGDSKPLENRDVQSGIADVVYTIYPYPLSVVDFAYDAARIASIKAGTIISATLGSESKANEFVVAFK